MSARSDGQISDSSSPSCRNPSKKVSLSGRSSEQFVADERDLAQCEVTLEKLTTALRARDIPTAVMADIAFHNAGARCTNNPAPLTLIATIEPIITGNRRDTIQSFDSEALAIPHLKISETIERQDSDGAAVAMEPHLKELMECLFQTEKS